MHIKNLIFREKQNKTKHKLRISRILLFHSEIGLMQTQNVYK